MSPSDRQSMPQPDQERTKSTYGLQWNRFRIIRADEDRATFRSRTGLSPNELEGQLVLDAGCGMGHYLRIAAESSVRLIVGLDLSHAVVAARELTAELKGRRRARRSAQAPFAAASFDISTLWASSIIRPIHARLFSAWPRF